MMDLKGLGGGHHDFINCTLTVSVGEQLSPWVEAGAERLQDPSKEHYCVDLPSRYVQWRDCYPVSSSHFIRNESCINKCRAHLDMSRVQNDQKTCQCDVVVDL
jgi:hypothetical protein